jgi:hypothetical protein
MALSDTARIALIAEVTPGVTPATPAFTIVRLDSDSLVWNVDSTQDPELNPDRSSCARLTAIRARRMTSPLA